MHTEKIKEISIKDFMKVKDQLDYCENDVIAIKNKYIPWGIGENVRLNCLLIIYCFEGESTISINEKDYILNKENIAVLLPNTTLRRIPTKEDQQGTTISVIGFSTRFLSSTIQLKKEIWDTAYRIYQNPVIPSSLKESYKFYLYKEMAYTLLNESPHPYHHEIMKHYFSAIFCEIMAEISKHLQGNQSQVNYTHNRSNWIFRKFIECVMQDDGTHRSVTYYADQLCYSSKHLSTIVKQECGQSPLKIINDHATELIKYHLKHSDKSMKELADLFDFANPSFFGKFFKQHTNMSPLQFRNLPKEEAKAIEK